MQHSANAPGVHIKSTPPRQTIWDDLAELAAQCNDDPVAFETTTRARAERQGVHWRAFRDIVRDRAKLLRASRAPLPSPEARRERQEAGAHFGAAHFPKDSVYEQAKALVAFLAARYGAQPFSVGRRLRVHVGAPVNVVDLEDGLLFAIVWAWNGVATVGPARTPLRLSDGSIKTIISIVKGLCVPLELKL
mgnify:CR=1 FL=1